jgi:hypothetical protein
MIFATDEQILFNHKERLRIPNLTESERGLEKLLFFGLAEVDFWGGMAKPCRLAANLIEHLSVRNRGDPVEMRLFWIAPSPILVRAIFFP